MSGHCWNYWVRFNLHEVWHREMVFRKMNEDWRASKSTLVRKVRMKEKTSEQFKKDMERIERDKPNSSSTNLKEDALSQVLGPEKRGRLRTFGKGVTLTRLTILSQMNGQFDALREENVQLRSEMSYVKNTVEELKKSQVQSSATTEETPTTPIVSPSIGNISSNTKCKLLDWMGAGDVVVEGRWSSSDPNETCHCVPIGPNAMKVWVDVAKKPEVFLWRPTSDLTYVVDAVGTTIAWPASQVIMDSSLGSIG